MQPVPAIACKLTLQFSTSIVAKKHRMAQTSYRIHTICKLGDVGCIGISRVANQVLAYYVRHISSRWIAWGADITLICRV